MEEDARDDQRVPVSLQFQTRAGFLEGFIFFYYEGGAKGYVL